MRLFSDFLAQGYMGNLTALPDLQSQLRYSNAQAARACFVSLEPAGGCNV